MAHSLKLRIQHEYFHYLSYRYFGSMRNNMHDELLADYMGLHAIKNSFDAQLFLQFVGLENYPEYRPGGRLENYLGNPPLSNKAFNVLCTIIYKAAKQLEQLDLKLGNPESVKNVVQRLFSISQFSLEEMASEDMLSEMAKQCLEITSY